MTPLPLALLVLAIGPSAPTEAVDVPVDVRSPWTDLAVRTEVEALRAARLPWPDRRGVREAVARFYAARDWTPAWLDAGRPTGAALGVAAVLAGADSRGLDPEAYGAPALADALAGLATGVALLDDGRAAALDVGLTVAALRYAGDVRGGRVDPRLLGHELPPDADPPDLAALAAELAASPDPAARLAREEPRWPQYQALVAALPGAPEAARRRAALALERWRWLPPGAAGPVVVVNLPEFRLWAMEPSPGGPRVALDMPVVIGRVDDDRNHTPLLAHQIVNVVFSPYWEVPKRIAERDLVKKFRADPGFAGRLGYVLDGPDGRRAVDAAGLARWRAGALRLRQLPGPSNALGRVMFLFPNEDDVYLHDTSDRALLARTSRTFSSGCIRVGDAASLAAWALRGTPGWDAARMVAAMRRGEPLWVAPRTPPQVLTTYATATVGPDGALRLLDDPYGEDPRLERALRTATDRLTAAHQERGRPVSMWTKSSSG